MYPFFTRECHLFQSDMVKVKKNKNLSTVLQKAKKLMLKKIINLKSTHSNKITV